MKKTFISVFILCCHLIAYSVVLPKPIVKFEYDEAGNRVKRHITIPALNVADSTGNEPQGVRVTMSFTPPNPPAISPADTSLELVRAEVYPNPTTGPFTVMISGQTATDVVIEVFSSIGERLLTKRASIGENNLDISIYPQGQYIVTVMDGAEMAGTFKIIKK